MFLKNRKGQALVEFVIILPVLLMIVFCLIDFGRIFYTKNDLEGIMDNVITMYNNGDDNNQINSYISKNGNLINFDVTSDNKYITFNLSKKMDIMTPGLNVILDDPYDVSVKRVLANE